MSLNSALVFLISHAEYFIALSGSFKPFPVKVQVIVAPSLTRPFLLALIKPATDAALAGSHRTPSVLANSLYASIISSSDTKSITPPDLSLAFSAFSQLAGFPILIAVAIVSGC